MSNVNLSSFKPGRLIMIGFFALVTLMLILSGCGGKDGKGGGGGDNPVTAPTITSITPDKQSTNTNLQTPIKLTFNMPMKTSSLNTDNIEIRDTATNAIAPLSMQGVSSDGKSVIYTLDNPLAPRKTYEIIVKAAKIAASNGRTLGVQDQIAGTFTTGNDNYPIITRLLPANNSNNISLTPHLLVSFNKKMQVKSLISENVQLMEIKADGRTVQVPIRVQSVRPKNKVVVFVPENPLSPNTIYHFTVNGSKIYDQGGKALRDSQTTIFTTGNSKAPTVASVAPFNGEDKLSRATDIAVTFSAAMDPDTINNANITLTDANGNMVPINLVSFSSDKTTAIFTVPATAPLAPNAPYTIKISKNVVSMNNTPLGVDNTVSFVTGSEVTPVIAATSPANGEKNFKVDMSSRGTIIFSTPMDRNSLAGNVYLEAPLYDETLHIDLKVVDMDQNDTIAIFEPVLHQGGLPKELGAAEDELHFTLYINPSLIKSKAGVSMDSSKFKDIAAEFTGQIFQ